MGSIRVRDLDDAVVLEFKARAQRAGSSLEGLVRTILTEEASRPRREWDARLRALRESILPETGLLPDSAPDIRAERDR